jgi:hypothetical protein
MTDSITLRDICDRAEPSMTRFLDSWVEPPSAVTCTPLTVSCIHAHMVGAVSGDLRDSRASSRLLHCPGPSHGLLSSSIRVSFSDSIASAGPSVAESGLQSVLPVRA